ncbi:hypothetical protein M427DRAFT_33683 [Gonapodya prolifera JEL478]|uniref:Uncharacterized protein n=1 Tax=Gonapodya prolifera (strain JEL478) TaxID=1344416 RepID=A0A139AAI0_GONPJ|nr:hypothetical protein M427DRAFT_33683 [Gonapodya prolifera JEL478]|eukprot:KXS13708.1 hypothetical protein M427DRAFT_33683 [Gonapodya prolifera JEL478]
MSTTGPELILRVSDAKGVEGMPKHTGAVLAGHVVFKTVQAGSVLGLGLAPLIRLRSKTPRPLLVALTRPAGMGTLLGIPLGLAAFAARSYQMDADGVDDRAYRIVNNAGQVEVDRYAGFGAFVGSLVGNFALPGGNILVRMWRGGSVGVAVGVGAYVLGRMEETKDLRQSVVDGLEKMKSGL